MHRNEADKCDVAARVRETIATGRGNACVSHVCVRNGNRESARRGNARSRPTTKWRVRDRDRRKSVLESSRDGSTRRWFVYSRRMRATWCTPNDRSHVRLVVVRHRPSCVICRRAHVIHQSPLTRQLIIRYDRSAIWSLHQHSWFQHKIIHAQNETNIRYNVCEQAISASHKQADNDR